MKFHDADRLRLTQLRSEGVDVFTAKRILTGENLRRQLDTVNPTRENSVIKAVLLDLIADLYPQKGAHSNGR